MFLSHLVTFTDLAYFFACRRIDNWKCFPAYGIHKLTIDKELQYNMIHCYYLIIKRTSYSNLIAVVCRPTLVNLTSGTIFRSILFKPKRSCECEFRSGVTSIYLHTIHSLLFSPGNSDNTQYAWSNYD